MILGLRVALAEAEAAEVDSLDVRDVMARTADARLVFRSGAGGREGENSNHECGGGAHGISGANSRLYRSRGPRRDRSKHRLKTSGRGRTHRQISSSAARIAGAGARLFECPRIHVASGLFLAASILLSAERTLDDFFREFKDEWMRLNTNLAAAQRYFTGPEQDAMERMITPDTPQFRKAVENQSQGPYRNP